MSLPTSRNQNQPKKIENVELARNVPLLHVLGVRRQAIVETNAEIVEKRAAEGEIQKGCTRCVMKGGIYNHVYLIIMMAWWCEFNLSEYPTNKIIHTSSRLTIHQTSWLRSRLSEYLDEPRYSEHFPEHFLGRDSSREALIPPVRKLWRSTQCKRVFNTLPFLFSPLFLFGNLFYF